MRPYACIIQAGEVLFLIFSKYLRLFAGCQFY